MYPSERVETLPLKEFARNNTVDFARRLLSSKMRNTVEIRRSTSGSSWLAAVGSAQLIRYLDQAFLYLSRLTTVTKTFCS